jgi:hypothetical protein
MTAQHFRRPASVRKAFNLHTMLLCRTARQINCFSYRLRLTLVGAMLASCLRYCHQIGTEIYLVKESQNILVHHVSDLDIATLLYLLCGFAASHHA